MKNSPENEIKKEAVETTARKTENRNRLKEFIEVLGKHEIIKGITPEKLCAIIKDLGPTFIKLGQILSMRSDILPPEYCAALTSLQSRVPPMPYDQVEEIVFNSFGQNINEIYAEFSREALGSASIGQVHKAKLKSGETVVVKVQRPGIHDTMSRDIALLKHAVRLMKLTKMGSVVDFGEVLDEMWIVAQQELNYLTEAENLERFWELNKDVAYVSTPKLYREYTTRQVLTMEFTAGYSLRDTEGIVAAGYDLNEIGTKLADNYIKQVLQDGFFHADPHPGNIHIRDGKIAWLDMGMMGKLSDHDRKLICRIIIGMAQGNVNTVMSAVLRIGDFHGDTDLRQLKDDLQRMVDKYGPGTKLSNINLSKLISEVVDILKDHNASLPGEFTMLVRGLVTIEGAVEKFSPDCDIVGIAAARIGNIMLTEFDWRGEVHKNFATVTDSAKKAIAIPALTHDILSAINEGETKLGMDVHITKESTQDLNTMVSKFSASVICAALIVFSGLFARSGPMVGTVSVFSVLSFIAAAALGVYVFVVGPKRKKKSKK